MSNQVSDHDTSMQEEHYDYDELFKDGPPKSDVIINTTDFDPEIQVLVPRVHELIETQTVCFALWKDRAAQLMDCYGTAFERNRFHYDIDTIRKKDVNGDPYDQEVPYVDDNMLLEALMKKQVPKHIGTGNNKICTVAWDPEEGFVNKITTVVYGNCPNCYKAMPMGWCCDNNRCLELENCEACRLYMVNIGPIPKQEPTTISRAAPFALAALAGATASVSLDDATYHKMPEHVEEEDERPDTIYYGYRPKSSKLWQVVWLEALFQHIDFKAFPYLERELRLATQLPMETIQQTMDEYKSHNEHLYPKRTWDSIACGRQIPDCVVEPRLQIVEHKWE